MVARCVPKSLWMVRCARGVVHSARRWVTAGARRLPILPCVIDLDALLARHHGILLASAHRSRKSSLSRWCRAGRLVRILAGVYVHPSARDDLDTRLRAVAARIPDAVFAGSAAARLTGWPDEEVGEIEVLTPTQRVPAAGYRFTRRRVPPESVHRHRRLGVLTATAIAVDSAAHDNGERIDDLLRARVPLASIEAAFRAAPHRPGNPARRRVVRRSRSNPWSQAERRLHDILDRHRITGWTANLPVTACGNHYVLDVGFAAERLALEVDGYEFHHGREAFESDRERGNDLVSEGWRQLHVTWLMLDDEERLIAQVQALLRPRSHRMPARGG